MMPSTPEPSLTLSQSWAGIWLTALTRPSVATYASLIQQPNATTRSAYRWVFTSGLISGVIGALVPFLWQWVQTKSLDTALLLAIPITPMLVVFSLAIFAGCTHWVARRLKGVGTYASLAYAFATFSAPLTILASLLALLPQSRLLLLGLYLYWLVLYALAVQAVNQFSRAKAVGSVLISFVLLGCALLGLVFLAAVARRPQ